MNLQIRIWISNVVLFVVPILIAIILFLLYFSGLRILANAGYYLRIEQEQQFKSVSRVAETITFYGIDNGLMDSLVKPSYSLLDPNEVYSAVTFTGNSLKIIASSASFLYEKPNDFPERLSRINLKFS